MIRVFLSGEGRNELGSWSGAEAYRSDGQPGIIKALLLKAMVRTVMEASIDLIPQDAVSLRGWLEWAKQIFPNPSAPR